MREYWRRGWKSDRIPLPHAELDGRNADIVYECSQHLEAIKPRLDQGAIVVGGATLDESAGMKPNGSVIIACADTKEEVVKMMESDVYTQNKVWDLSKVS